MIFDSLEKLYVHELKDLHNAEKQELEVLEKMEQAASDKDLKGSLSEHREKTQQHLDRLETIFAQMDFQSGGHRCQAMEGIIKEADEIMSSEIESHVLDAALVAAAQRMEHYEMAGYGTARAFAEKMGHHEAADLLQQTLDEEGGNNRELTRLAERSINFLATKAAMS